MDENLQLRDKLAIEILQAIISHPKTDAIDGILTLINSEHDSWKETGINRAEYLIRGAYKLADIMRKIRLESFT